MKTKNIFKTLVLAAVLVSACGKNEIADDFKGYTLPVTVNVTRQGDEGTTRASYNESTRKLSFSEGDILFVGGKNTSAGAGYFDGALDYDAVSGKFSGTITTQFEYTGTADELFTAPNYIHATLLPKGYEDYGYLYIEHLHAEGYGFEDCIGRRHEYTFATSKAAAVEQFSFEQATSYSSGFALSPENAILNFTITGLAASTNVAVALTGSGYTITKTVTTDSSGNAKFAVGIGGNYDLNNFTLTVAGNPITLVTESKTLTAGKIYNISRSVAPATPTLTLTSPTVGQVIGSDGKNYAAGASLPTGVTKVAMIAYVNGSNGLAIALADESGYMNWATAKSTCEAKTPAFTGGTWKLPSLDEWKNMLTYDGDLDSYMNNNLQTALSTAGGNSLQEWIYYWSSTDYDSDNTEACDVEFQMGGANFSHESKTYTSGMAVRAVLAF